MKNNFVVAIPSYKRAKEQISLNYLKSLRFPKADTFIFVQTEEDLRAYQDAWDDDATIIYRQASSISQARNNILTFFDGSTNVLMIDDDIKKIGKLDCGKIKDITDGEDFVTTINACFDYASKKGQLFGIYPIYNAFFMDNSISTRVTVNTVLGFCKGNRLNFDTTLTAKEDIDLCGRLLNMMEPVYRFNNLAVYAKHRTNDGGCKDTWDTDANEKAVRMLCMRYPRIFAPKKNNPKEVRVICKDIKL